MVTAIIVTHGNLGAELIAAAREIFGSVAGCHAVSNRKKSPQVVSDEIHAIISSEGPDDHFVLLVDFFGGSCCHTCVGVERKHRNTCLITGVNLPMLLAFLYKRDEVPFDELPGELIARGHDSIQLVSERVEEV